jgi:hypothetical protein
MKLPEIVIAQIVERRDLTIDDFRQFLYTIDIPTECEELLSIRKIAAEAFDYWDSDQDMKVGKILRALAGELPGYRADIDKINTRF